MVAESYATLKVNRRPRERVKPFTNFLSAIHPLFFFQFASAAQRGSVSPCSQEHSPAFKSAPHFWHKPLQSSRQRLRVGSARRICSRTSSSRSTESPS